MDEPEKLAKYKMYDSVNLLSPLDKTAINSNKSFQLKWESNSEQFGILYVINNGNNVILMEEQVKMNDNYL